MDSCLLHLAQVWSFLQTLLSLKQFGSRLDELILLFFFYFSLKLYSGLRTSLQLGKLHSVIYQLD